MKHLKLYEDHSSDPTRDELEKILELMDTLPEGRDLKATEHYTPSIQLIEGKRVVSLRPNRIIYYNPKGQLVLEYEEEKIIQSTFSTPKKLFTFLWLEILMSPGFNPYISTISTKDKKSDYKNWLLINAAGLELSQDEIVRKWLMEVHGIYHPSNANFLGATGERIKKSLGLLIYNKLALQYFEPTVTFFFNIYVGTLGPLFTILKSYYGDSKTPSAPRFKYTTALTPKPGSNLYGRIPSITNDSNSLIKASSEEEYKETVIKDLIEKFSTLPWDNSEESTLSHPLMRSLIIGELLGSDMTKTFKKIYQEIKDSPNSLKTLKSIRDTTPEIWSLMLGDDTKEISRGNLGADLGGFGF